MVKPCAAAFFAENVFMAHHRKVMVAPSLARVIIIPMRAPPMFCGMRDAIKENIMLIAANFRPLTAALFSLFTGWDVPFSDVMFWYSSMVFECFVR